MWVCVVLFRNRGISSDLLWFMISCYFVVISCHCVWFRLTSWRLDAIVILCDFTIFCGISSDFVRFYAILCSYGLILCDLLRYSKILWSFNGIWDFAYIFGWFCGDFVYLRAILCSFVAIS